MSVVASDATVRDFDSGHVADLIQLVRATDGVGNRVAEIGRIFMDAPYRSNPLGGSEATPEEFTLALDGFDCVTYVEYALALARSETPAEFVDNVREIRYAGGAVGWNTRNHYMSQWIRRNVRAGFVRDRTRGLGLVERRRNLDTVTGVEPLQVTIRSIRKRAFLGRLSEVVNGDLVFFASTRRHLDVFHCGILAVDANREVALRHAARSRGRVVQQSLSSFLMANRMPGVIHVRPVPK